MSFIFNRGAIIFIICSIVSLLPIGLSWMLILFMHTVFYQHSKIFSELSLFAAVVLYVTPIVIFFMGDALFYLKFIKHQDIVFVEKLEIVIAFFMAFTIYYVAYFLSIDVVVGFISMLT